MGSPVELVLVSEVLAILNGMQSISDSIDAILAVIKRETGFDAVGIRLRKGEDYPYADADGFSESFIRAENSLAVRDSAGGACRDAEGNVKLECTCGLVIGGRTDPSNPLFTAGGSAWTNDAREVLKVPPSEDPRLHARNRCIHDGYLSVALIPIRIRDEIVGLLQLNDRRANRLSLEMVQSFERLTSALGVAFLRLREEQALRESESNLRSLFDLASIGMAQADPADGRWLRVNRRLCAITGYSEQEMLHLRVSDITHPDDRARDWEAFQRVVRGELPNYWIEKRYLRKDGTVAWVSVNLTVIRDEAGRPLRTMATIEDVSERKRAERRTLMEAERTEVLLSLHQKAVGMSASELRRYVMGKALKLTESAFAFCYRVSADQQRIEASIWLAGGGIPGAVEELAGEALPCDGVLGDCVGMRRPVVVNAAGDPCAGLSWPASAWDVRRFIAVPVVEDGAVAFVLGVADKDEAYADADVSHLQVVVNEMQTILVQRESQERLRKLSEAVEQSPVSVVITDTTGAIEYVNPSFTRVTGYTLEEVRGRNPRLLKSGETPSEQYRDLWRAILEGRQWHGEFHNRRKDGRSYWEVASISPIRDGSGRITHFVAVKEDVTELKRLEAQYRQAQKLEAVGQLAGGVAHDFNNILAVFMMNVELLQMSPDLSEDSRSMLVDLLSQARRAADLTRQLLMFSRRSVMVPRPMDLNEVVTDLLKMLRRLLGETVTLEFEAAPQLPLVEADKGLLEQVLMNLVVNARDAMTGREGIIRIRTSVLERLREEGPVEAPRPPGCYVCLSVNDAGTGMDADTLKRIFEPFFTTKEPGKGTGLGLATVHGIVAQHRGWVEVDSRIGEGSAFRVLLPAIGGARLAAVDSAPAPPIQRGEGTILLVEDEAPVRRLVGRLLRKLGYEVHEAANGPEAMALWDRCAGRIDLLVTDMVMPEGLTGVELAARLQSLRPGLKAVISSGYSEEILKTGVPTRPGIAYLPKPFEAGRLATLVASLLGDRGG